MIITIALVIASGAFFFARHYLASQQDQLAPIRVKANAATTRGQTRQRSIRQLRMKP